MKKICLVICFIGLCFQYAFAQQFYKLHLKIDARAFQNRQDFGLRGSISPLSWNETLILQDPDGDGIYETSLEFNTTPHSVLEFKCVYGQKKLVYELPGQNRIVVLNEPETTISFNWNMNENHNLTDLPVLSSVLLLEDFKIAKEALESLHPGLLNNLSKEKLDSIWTLYKSIFSKDMSYGEVFLNYSNLTAAFGCGHTFPNFYNQDGLIKQILFEQNHLLPYTFRHFEGRLFINKSADTSSFLPQGTEILSINGQPIDNILNELKKYIRADAFFDGKKDAELNVFGYGHFEYFDALFHLLFPPQNQSLKLEVQKPNSAKDILEVKGMSLSTRTRRLQALYIDQIRNADELWSFKLINEQTAYLKLGTFDVFQLEMDWRGFLKNAFKEIKKNKCKNLIVDIRWNEGGQDEVLSYLAYFLAKSDIKTVSRKNYVSYKTIEKSLRPYVYTWDTTFYDLSKKVKTKENGLYRYIDDDVTSISKSKTAFQGDVYILINGANSSATFYLAELVKFNKLATLVGKRTGGSQQSMNGGIMMFLRLPNSRIEIDIPIICSINEGKPNMGIEPDLIVEESYENYWLNQDDYVLRVLEEISKYK